jgi:hypothetical protein
MQQQAEKTWRFFGPVVSLRLLMYDITMPRKFEFKEPVQFTLKGSCTICIFKAPLQFTDSPFVAPSLTVAGPHDARQ